METSTWESILVGWKALWEDRLQSALAMLGIVVGVAALVAILAVADGAEAWSRRQILQTTTLHAIIVEPVASELVDGVRVEREDTVMLTPADLESLKPHLGSMARAWLDARRPARLEVEAGSPSRGVVVHGVTGPELFDRSNVLEGRGLDAGDFADTSFVAVVNETLGRSLLGAAQGYSALFGQELALASGRVRIVGVQGGRPTPQLWVPFPVFQRIFPGGGDAPTLVIESLRLEDTPLVREEVAGWLRRRFGSMDGVRVTSQQEQLEQVRQGLLVLRLVLGTIVGISVVVGGVGIMNVLLGAVARRTREIGVRKAMGARRRDILMQFLAESVAVSVAGAAIGVLLGAFGALAASALIRMVTDADLYAVVTAGPPLVAAVVALLVGILSGAYPAFRAARLPPIDAIRHE